MDPITAALTLTNTALILATKIWDATPETQKATGAGDWAKFVHGMVDGILSLQSKINAAVK